MLERTIRESWTSEDVHELQTRLKQRKKDQTPFYDQCKIWVCQSEEERKKAQEAKERGEAVPESLETMQFGRSDYGHKFRMDKALVTLGEKELYSRVVCCLCSDIPSVPTATDVRLFLSPLPIL